MRLFELDWVRFVHFEWLVPALAPASREALLGARARQRFDAEELGADAQLLEREGFLARTSESWRLTPGTPAILRALRFLERVRDEVPGDNPSLREALASGASFAPGERAAGERLERALAEAGGALALSQLELVLPDASAADRARAIGVLLDAGRAHPWWNAHSGRVELRAWPRAAESVLAEDCAAPREPWLVHELSLALTLGVEGALGLRADGQLREGARASWRARQASLPGWLGPLAAEPRARQAHVLVMAQRYGLLVERRGLDERARLEPSATALRWHARPLLERWRTLLRPLRVAGGDPLGQSCWAGVAGDLPQAAQLLADSLARLPGAGSPPVELDAFLSEEATRSGAGDVLHALFHAALERVLLPLAAVRLERDARGRARAGLTPAGAHLIGRADEPAALPELVRERALVQPDFTLQLLGHEPDLELRFASIARRGELPGAAPRFQLDAASLRAAGAAGLDSERVRELLAPASQRPLPANVAHELEHWLATGARIEVSADGQRWHCPDQESAARALARASGALRSAGETSLFPAPGADLPRLERELRQAGLHATCAASPALSPSSR